MLVDALRRPLVVVGLVIIAAGCWSLLTPEGGGPDESTHLVRSAGLARGQFFDDDGAYTIPDTVLPRDISCWAFDPFTPASCATERETVGAILDVPSTAEAYPIWSHLFSGLASRLPGASPLWWARAANVVLAGALVGAAAVALRRRPLPAASLLVALTPMAWFSFGIVNPSAMAISGAIALWVGLVHRPDLGWLTAVGFTALALPRRDGLIWACAAVALWLLIDDRRFVDWWRSLSIPQRILVGGATAATAAWGLTSEATVSRLVVLAPLAFVAAEAARWWRRRLWSFAGAARTAASAVTVVALVAAVAVVAALRPRGWDGELAGRVLGEAGPNLVEAIGRLGWLDAPLPGPVIAGWVLLLGVLAGASMADRSTWIGGAAAIVGASVVAAWVFELYQGSESGTYWQGRYTLPLLAGAPLVLGAARVRGDIASRLAAAVGAAAVLMLNVALWAATRRFGVGLDGSLLPWNWDTYDAPLPVVLALVVHAAATTGILIAVVGVGDRPAASEASAVASSPTAAVRSSGTRSGVPAGR